MQTCFTSCSFMSLCYTFPQELSYFLHLLLLSLWLAPYFQVIFIPSIHLLFGISLPQLICYHSHLVNVFFPVFPLLLCMPPQAYFLTFGTQTSFKFSPSNHLILHSVHPCHSTHAPHSALSALIHPMFYLN